MKTLLKPTILTLGLLVAMPAMCEEVEPQAADAPAFPAEAAATELSAEQQAKAQENLEKAVKLYDEVLDYNHQGQYDTVKRNLEYIQKRIGRVSQEKSAKMKSLEELDKHRLAQYSMIEAMRVSQEIKDQKLREAKVRFDEEEGYLKHRVQSLTAQLSGLQQRREVLDSQLQTLAASGKAAGAKTWDDIDRERADKARDEFKELKRDEQEKRAGQYEGEL